MKRFDEMVRPEIVTAADKLLQHGYFDSLLLSLVRLSFPPARASLPHSWFPVFIGIFGEMAQMATDRARLSATKGQMKRRGRSRIQRLSHDNHLVLSCADRGPESEPAGILHRVIEWARKFEFVSQPDLPELARCLLSSLCEEEQLRRWLHDGVTGMRNPTTKLYTAVRLSDLPPPLT